jgi:PAS domain S-box-containing protein
VTERRAADEALRASEALFRQFGEASSDSLWVRNAGSLQFEYLSPAFEKIYGTSRSSVLSGDTLSAWAQLLHPHDREAVLANLDRVRAGERITQQFRIVRPCDGEVRWVEDTDFPIRDATGAVHRFAGIAKDVTDARRATERQQVLVSELQHRSRNLLGLIRSLASKTVGRGGSIADFEDRLAALGRAQGLLSQFGSDTVELGALVRAELEAHAEIKPPRIIVEGPPVSLSVKQVQTLALALHELATNAVKYGALDSGRLSVTWTVTTGPDETRKLHLAWDESGVSVPPEHLERKGFGRELIEKALAYSLEADTSYVIGSDGVKCRIEIPLERYA